ncbi:RICIN domain-containing protein [Nonomuraea fuscirosea]|uniref:RICIN domain-containing protein n=1 Tax=Nonomuraea fuscirosea TaxID=1291556 RepID=UPI00346F044E
MLLGKARVLHRRTPAERSRHWPGSPELLFRSRGRKQQSRDQGLHRAPGNQWKALLDVEGFRTDPGAPVIVWPCHGGSNQQWRVSEYYKGPNKGIRRIEAVGSGKCLDLRNPTFSIFYYPLPPHLTPMQIWDCFPDQGTVWWSKNQSWLFAF